MQNSIALFLIIHMKLKNNMTRKTKIGVMGGIGSFSEEAANSYCEREKLENFEFDYLINAENVLSALCDEKIDFGVLGIANSISGVVLTSVEAMGKFSFEVVDMFEIDICQNLLVKPGTKIDDIKKVVSQLPALGQCGKYLKEKLPKAELQDYEDTAKAARDLAEGILPETSAAIANISCAELFNLEVLQKSIQDDKNNRTTFVVVKK